MASNVFGNPITDKTLQGMPEYFGKKIRRIDRAHVALNMKNAEGKDIDARNHVQNLKHDWGDGISTLCLVYNATGDPITYVTDHDWHGHIGKAPYPLEIANGQWAAFLHVKTGPTFVPIGSSGAVVYRAKNDPGYGSYSTECDWMICWSVPYVGDNAAYSEIRGKNHFDNTVWGVISDKMDASGHVHNEKMYGCMARVCIGEYTSPIYEAVITLQNAENPPRC